MKKTFLVLALLAVLGTNVYAQTPKLKTSEAAPKRKSVAALIERSQGKIESIQKADISNGNFGKFKLADASGTKKEFELIAKSQLFSSKSAPIEFSNLKKGDEVTVLYVVTLKGINDVITVTLTK